MIRLLITFFITLLSLMMNAQVKSTFTLGSAVNILDVSMPIQVYVDATKDSDTIEIVAEKQEGIDLVRLRQLGDKLVIDFSSTARNTKANNLGKIQVYISQKSIEKFSVSTVAKVIVEGRLKVDNAILSLDSSSSLTADVTAKTVGINMDSASKYTGNITAKTIKVNIDSAAKATVSGDTENLTVNVDSAGTFDGKELKAKYVKVEADSMGKAEVYPTESLNAYADSMGKVIYHNTPKEIKKYTDSMGSVKSK
ncbi:GIN domain-containing protein [Myroides injenensis]|uniref:GIN domain-containing protein n=1 Tax=Myroides injenensis TaxID=1183151 RepID=UPI0004749FA1|nr:DUF2807 domain-containing protein [Myroides injenensis]